MTTVGELCQALSGGTPSTKDRSLWDGTIPWITGADIKSDGHAVPRQYITEKAIKYSSTTIAPTGAVLLVTRTSVGKVGIADRPTAFSQDITALVPDEERVDGRYLARMLVAHEHDLSSQARGATIRGVTRETVLALDVPLPPMREQRRIADVLDRTDALRAVRRRAIADLDRLIEAVFLHTFGDPFTNPKGWPRRRLADLGALERGVSRHRPRNDPALLGGPYPFIQTGDVANARAGYIRSYSSSYSSLGLSQSKIWPAGTLCITIAANIAKVAVLTFPACFPDSVVGFVSDSATTEFVRAWLALMQHRIESSAPQSAQKNINLRILRELEVICPPNELRAWFAARVASAVAVREQQSVAVELSDSLFSSVQFRAFRGEL